MSNVVDLAQFRAAKEQPMVQPNDITRDAMAAMIEALRPCVDLSSSEVITDIKMVTWLVKGLVDRQYDVPSLAVPILDSCINEANEFLPTETKIG